MNKTGLLQDYNRITTGLHRVILAILQTVGNLQSHQIYAGTDATSSGTNAATAAAAGASPALGGTSPATGRTSQTTGGTSPATAHYDETATG